MIDVVALSRRDLGRPQGVAIAIYVASYVIVVGLSLPVAPLGSLLWVFPAAIRVAVTVMLIGGRILASAFRAEQAIAHPEHRPPPAAELTETELRAAEAYDEKWQIADRERNRELESHSAHRRMAPPWRRLKHRLLKRLDTGNRSETSA